MNNSYLVPGNTKPFAWLIYLILIFVLKLFGDLGGVLAIFPWCAFIYQVIVNTWRRFYKNGNN